MLVISFDGLVDVLLAIASQDLRTVALQLLSFALRADAAQGDAPRVIYPVRSIVLGVLPAAAVHVVS